jgi:hypothetical protein
MDGQKRVSDGSLAEWIKEVEADAPDEGQPAGKNKTAGVKKPCSPTLQPAGKVNDGTTRYEATRSRRVTRQGLAFSSIRLGRLLLLVSPLVPRFFRQRLLRPLLRRCGRPRLRLLTPPFELGNSLGQPAQAGRIIFVLSFLAHVHLSKGGRFAGSTCAFILGSSVFRVAAMEKC